MVAAAAVGWLLSAVMPLLAIFISGGRSRGRPAAAVGTPAGRAARGDPPWRPVLLMLIAACLPPVLLLPSPLAVVQS
eukprot:SAG31_NODE_680_length_12881_cov_35.655453_10_plen_77_part_00